MSAVSCPRIFQVNVDEFGLNESYQEFQKEPLFCVMCDALYLPKPELNAKIAKGFERVIKEFILLRYNEFGEKLLTKAIAHAQKYFFKNYSSLQSQLKICICIVMQSPFSAGASSTKKVYAAGVGDIKLFSVTQNPKLLFYDPEISLFSDQLSFKKRFQYITNAIGCDNYKLKISKIDADEKTLLALATYGLYNEAESEKLFLKSSNFESKKNYLQRLLSRPKDFEHLNHYMLLSLDNRNYLNDPSKITSQSQTSLDKSENNKNRNVILFVLKILAILGILCTIFQLGNSNYMNTNSSKKNLQNPLIEPEKQINLNALKHPFKAPFFKERAFIIDLKEKYEKQRVVIEKLNQKIRRQDRALRNLQIKSFEPHRSTFSTKYRPIVNTTESEPKLDSPKAP